ncbi:MAG: extracellular solute-binding protein, partial [Chloroflexota bacterium]
LAAACSPSNAGPAPAPPVAGTAAPAGKAPWEKEWDELVAAAKLEGKIAFVTRVGTGYRTALEVFEKAFPGIVVEQRQFATPRLSEPVILAERGAGIYNWDLWEGSSTIALPSFRPKGVLAPLRPLLLRPDATDDSKWLNGFESGWLDNEKKLGYAFGAEVGGWFAIDSRQVGEGELKTFQDLLAPKWKGRIMLQDVRQGATGGPMTSVRAAQGDEMVRRLIIDQQPTFSQDPRAITEALIRGQFPIGLGVTKPVLQQFLDQGVGQQVKFVDLPPATYITYTNAIWYLDRAPHPNASKLFVNWLLTKEGQSAWAEHTQINSLRTDVPPQDPSRAPAPGRRYYAIGPEATIDDFPKTTEYMQKLIVA